jgi:YHS domain-containing protein
MTKDPVCGMLVEETAMAAATSEYQGDTFYFCSESCKRAFEADPKRYASLALAERRGDTAPG